MKKHIRVSGCGLAPELRTAIAKYEHITVQKHRNPDDFVVMNTEIVSENICGLFHNYFEDV